MESDLERKAEYVSFYRLGDLMILNAQRGEEIMRAVELNGYQGFQSLRVVEVEKPKPGVKEILIEVRAAGVTTQKSS